MSQPAQASDDRQTFAMFRGNDAPAGSQAPLLRLEKAVGMIPNLAATMAGSPALIDGFVSLREVIHSKSLFNAQERELIFLTNATTNRCDYCQCVHSLFAKKSGLSDETIKALRDEEALADPRLDALATFARRVVENRGHVPWSDIGAFLDAGYTQQHVLDLVACVAQSVLANYTNHIARVQLDEALGG